MLMFFFFKQKTAYEMRISDWSSDVCSSDLDGVVPGFSEGLQLMKRGGKYRLWIPPQLGYGSDVPEGGPIPKDSVLMFDVELLDYLSKAKLMQRSEEHTSELQSLMRISYAVFCLKKKKNKKKTQYNRIK